jgi:hypothetical protein
LYTNKIGDEGARSLADALHSNHTLQSLEYLLLFFLLLACIHFCFSLIQNKITDAGAQALLDALAVNKTLKELKFAPSHGLFPLTFLIIKL